MRSKSRDIAPEVVSWPPRTMELNITSHHLQGADIEVNLPHVRNNNFICHSILFVRINIGLHCQKPSEKCKNSMCRWAY